MVLDFNFHPFHLGLSGFLAIFLASISGSLHCVSMCGGIALYATQGKHATMGMFHFARLAGYLSLGLFAGLMGNALLFQLRSIPIQGIAIVLMLGTLIFTIYRVFKGAFGAHPSAKMMRLGFSLNPVARSAWVGFFSAFLPCGWLYTFVILSMMSGSILGSMLTLTAFWLGTLPALSIGPYLLKIFGASGNLRVRQGIAMMVILTGVASTWGHIKMLNAPNTESTPQMNCHP